MALVDGSLVEIALKYTILAQTCMNVFQYKVSPPVGDPGAVNLGAAWWASVKTAYRNLAVDNEGAIFQTVRVRQIDDPAGDFGEYPIPTGEKAGLRGGTGTSAMPAFNAIGIRLTVDTRTTRPGQKRISLLKSDDVSNGAIAGGVITLAAALGALFSAQMTLGAPALLTVLTPIVCRKDPTTGAVIAHQDVKGYLVNPNATSQVSRKIGRGV